MLNHRMIVCRKFEKYNDNQRVIELALPVEVCECVAYRVSERNLDALSETILELMSIDIVNDSEISKTMDVSPDLVKLIKQSVLYAHSYITDDNKKITEEGKKYLLNGESAEFQNERVFGNMFVSIPDGEVLPYFLEGKLPTNQLISKETYKILVDDSKELVKDHTYWIPKFIKAYKLFARINRYSESEETDEIEFVRDELTDVLYEEVSDPGDKFTPIMNGEVDKVSSKSYEFIRILNTEKRQTYLKTKVVFSIENPDSYVVLSPFQNNMTPWFNKRLEWQSENDFKVSGEDGQETTLKELFRKTTEAFYVQFPELQADNFEYWLGHEYPNLKKLSSQNHLVSSFKRLYNLTRLFQKDQVEAADIIIKSEKLLETVLNNYIEISGDQRAVLDKFRSFGDQDRIKIKEIFGSYGILECVALRNDKWKESLRNFTWKKYGSSVADRYFYLTLDAYFLGKSPFKKILESDGSNFIANMDYLNRKRNDYGAHSDDIQEKIVPKEEFEKFSDTYSKVMKVLINILFEEVDNG